MMRAANPLKAFVKNYIGLDRKSFHYGLRLSFSAWLAFTIATVIGIQNAFWAAMPIFVVAQATRGLTLERGIYRVLGTIIGAIAGFGILQFIDTPYLALSLLAIWVGLFAGITHLLHGVHSYAALLSGITAAVVIIPSMFQPEAYLELAIARVICTIIGVLVITIVAWFFTPDSDLDRFYQQVCRLPGHAFLVLAKVLQQAPSSAIDQEEQATLQLMSQLENTVISVTAGSREGYKRAHHVQAMLVACLSILAAARRIQARTLSVEQSAQVQGFAQALLNYFAQTQEERIQAITVEQEHALLNMAQQLDPYLLEDLQLLIQAQRHLLSQSTEQSAQQATVQTEPADARAFGHKIRYLAPQRDWRLARQTGLIALTCTWLSTTMAYASGSIVLELGSLGVAMFSMILGSMPSPQKIAPHLLKGIIVGSSLAIVYRLVIYPYVHEPFILILSILPFLLLGGLARASKRYMFAALDANMSFLIASQAVWPHLVSDPFHIISESISLMAAAAIVSSGFIFLPRSDDRKANHAALLLKKELHQLIHKTGTNLHEWEARSSRHVIRLMLNITQSHALHHMAPRYSIASLNFGHSASQLLKILPKLTDESRYILHQLPEDLKTFEQDPVQLAARLMQYAQELARLDSQDSQAATADSQELEQRSILLLNDAAQALINGADFFRSSHDQRMASSSP